MKISIISTVYNKEKFLKEHIKSMINQTYKNIEFIFVNDGSVDNSLNILNNFAKKDKRIIVINQKNQGPNIARKNGFLKASGEYVYFVDSDDTFYDDNVIFNVVNCIKSDGNPDCVIGQLLTQYDNKNVVDYCIYKTDLKKSKYDISYLYDNIFRANLSSKIFKKNKIKPDYFINTRNFEDCYLSYLTLNNCKNFYYLDSIFYVINRQSRNNESLTSNMSLDSIKTKYDIIDFLKMGGVARKFNCSIEKLLLKTYLDDLNFSISLNNEDLKILLKYLNTINKKIKFNINYTISFHYRKIFILRGLYECFFTNRIIKEFRKIIKFFKKIIRGVVK